MKRIKIYFLSFFLFIFILCGIAYTIRDELIPWIARSALSIKMPYCNVKDIAYNNREILFKTLVIEEESYTLAIEKGKLSWPQGFFQKPTLQCDCPKLTFKNGADELLKSQLFTKNVTLPIACTINEGYIFFNNMAHPSYSFELKKSTNQEAKISLKHLETLAHLQITALNQEVSFVAVNIAKKQIEELSDEVLLSNFPKNGRLSCKGKLTLNDENYTLKLKEIVFEHRNHLPFFIDSFSTQIKKIPEGFVFEQIMLISGNEHCRAHLEKQGANYRFSSPQFYFDTNRFKEQIRSYLKEDINFEGALISTQDGFCLEGIEKEGRVSWTPSLSCQLKQGSIKTSQFTLSEMTANVSCTEELLVLSDARAKTNFQNYEVPLTGEIKWSFPDRELNFQITQNEQDLHCCGSIEIHDHQIAVHIDQKLSHFNNLPCPLSRICFESHQLKTIDLSFLFKQDELKSYCTLLTPFTATRKRPFQLTMQVDKDNLCQGQLLFDDLQNSPSFNEENLCISTLLQWNANNLQLEHFNVYWQGQQITGTGTLHIDKNALVAHLKAQELDPAPLLHYLPSKISSFIGNKIGAAGKVLIDFSEKEIRLHTDGYLECALNFTKPLILHSSKPLEFTITKDRGVEVQGKELLLRDCSTDAILATISLPKLHYNPSSDELFCKKCQVTLSRNAFVDTLIARGFPTWLSEKLMQDQKELNIQFAISPNHIEGNINFEGQDPLTFQCTDQQIELSGPITLAHEPIDLNCMILNEKIPLAIFKLSHENEHLYSLFQYEMAEWKCLELQGSLFSSIFDFADNRGVLEGKAELNLHQLSEWLPEPLRFADSATQIYFFGSITPPTQKSLSYRCEGAIRGYNLDIHQKQIERLKAQITLTENTLALNNITFRDLLCRGQIPSLSLKRTSHTDPWEIEIPFLEIKGRQQQSICSAIQLLNLKAIFGMPNTTSAVGCFKTDGKEGSLSPVWKLFSQNLKQWNLASAAENPEKEEHFFEIKEGSLNFSGDIEADMSISTSELEQAYDLYFEENETYLEESAKLDPNRLQGSRFELRYRSGGGLGYDQGHTSGSVFITP